MELAYGKFGRNLITKMMSEVKDKGNLIKRIDLFTDEKCDILKKYIILKFLAKERKININKKATIEEEIKELEKYINLEQSIIKSSNQTKEESQILGHKIKRITEEKISDNNSDWDEFKKEGDIIKKDDNDYIDNDTEFKKLYKDIIYKYGFKTNGNILKEIYEKMKDKSLDSDDLYALHFEYDYLCDVS